jgi:thiamine biosynthesis protein ThiS
MKTILLNGVSRQTAAENIAALVVELGFTKGTVLVELNDTALRPDEWSLPLKESDRVEILRIVAGG